MIIYLIFKKEDRAECSNYRGISLLPQAFKIYERILEGELRAAVEEKLNEAQYGFKPGRGTTDLTFTMKMLVEHLWIWKNNLIVYHVGNYGEP